MKNILLPTDFSKNSLNAIKYALALLKGKKINFFLLNVQKASNYTTSDLMSTPANTTVYRAILEDNKTELNKLITTIKKDSHSEAFKFMPLVDFDIFTDAITQVVQSNEIDLIIMGTNGATGAEEVIFGSNTLKVIRDISCPVLTIPEGFRFQKIKTILFSVNNQNKFDDGAVQTLKELLIQYKSKLKILDIKEKGIELIGMESKENIEALFSDFEYSYYTLTGIPAPLAINAFEQLFPVELHALIVEKQSFMNRFLFGSETSKISYGSRIPLLVMRD